MARDPKAEVEITAHSRGLPARLREARVKFSRFGAELKKEIFGKDLVEKGFWGKAGAHMVGGLGARAIGTVFDRTAGFIGESASSAMKFEDQLVRLQIMSNKTAGEIQSFGQDVRDTSRETGIGADKILSAAQAYVALTGDIDGATGASRQWARVAQATNSDVSDIAKTAAALKQNLDIKPDQMEAAFSALAVQGKEGAIELKDLASQLSSIAPQWAEFGGGKGVRGLKELGAALQVVKRGFGGDASETVTGLQSLLNAFQKNEKKFRAKGVHIYESDGKTLRNVRDIVRDIGDSKLFRNSTQLEHAFGRVEAYRAYLQLKENRDVLDELVDKAGDANAIGRDFDAYMATPAGRMAAATERMKVAIAEAFTPERIEMFASLLEGAASKLEGLFKTLSDYQDFVSGKDELTKNPYEAQVDKTEGTAATVLDSILPGFFGDRASDILDQEARDRNATTAAQAQMAGPLGDAARKQIANRQQFDATMAEINGGGTRADRVRAAVAATTAGQNAQTSGPGWEGRLDAGRAYLLRQGVKPDEVNRVRAQSQAEAAQLIESVPSLITQLSKATTEAIADGFRKVDGRPIEVKADGNKIVDVHRNASVHARRPGG